MMLWERACIWVSFDYLVLLVYLILSATAI